MLLRAWQRARADGGELILIGISRQVARTLHILGVDRLFATYDRVEDALSS